MGAQSNTDGALFLRLDQFHTHTVAGHHVNHGITIWCPHVSRPTRLRLPTQAESSPDSGCQNGPPSGGQPPGTHCACPWAVSLSTPLFRQHFLARRFARKTVQTKVLCAGRPHDGMGSTVTLTTYGSKGIFQRRSLQVPTCHGPGCFEFDRSPDFSDGHNGNVSPFFATTSLT